MNIMVTLPEDPEEREALRRRAARLHAEAICGALSALRCPAEQKKALLDGMLRPDPPEKSRKCPKKPGKEPWNGHS